MLMKSGKYEYERQQELNSLDEVFRSFESLFSGIDCVENTELRALLLRDVIESAIAVYEALPGMSRVSPARRGPGDNAPSD